jgi:mRNA interferase RelE/StbE
MVKAGDQLSYRVWLEPEVHAGRNQLPGKIRQRIKKLMAGFITRPRQAGSQPLDSEGLNLPDQIEIRRFRLENWRIIYAVNDDEKWVWVLAIRQRPPYDYEDLPELAAKLRE